MRTIGIFAVFALGLVAIVEGALLYSVSSDVDRLAAEVALLREAPMLDERIPVDRPTRPSTGPAQASPRPLPTFTAAPATQGAVPPAALGEVLSTPEGRQQLKGALDAIKEEERQTRLVKNVAEEEQDDERWREKLVRLGQLAPHEQQQVRAMFAQLGDKRRRTVEDMRVGLKSAKQADDEIDDAEDGTEKALKTLVGEQRWKAYRDAEKKEKEAKEAKEAAKRQRELQKAQAAGVNTAVRP